MISKTIRSLAILSVLLLAPAILCAGANTWTGNSLVPTTASTATFLGADPRDPYVVYAAFGADLYRSADGGRTWNHLRSFGQIDALLVHPAAPTTIYVGVAELVGTGNYVGVEKSTDGGGTWTRIPFPDDRAFHYVKSLAGSPTDSSLIYAGTEDGRIFRTDTAGATWSSSTFLGVAGFVSSLVIDPRDESVAYAGTQEFDTDYYFYRYPFGDFAKSSNSGNSWQDLDPGSIGAVGGIGIDSDDPSIVYLGTGYDSRAGLGGGVLRSENSGATWSSARAGLPPDVDVLSLAVDPRVSGRLYIGTTSGLYRSHDAGRSWAPFGQQLATLSVTSLSIGGDGRFLHAGVPRGFFDFEFADGPLDVAAAAGGASRILSWSADRLSVGTLDASGQWTSAPFGDPSPFWTATAIASGGDGLARVLWQKGNGRAGLEMVGPAGRESAFVFSTRFSDWMASDLSVRSDGLTTVLWTSAGGKMFIAAVSSSGAESLGHEYGPAQGWTAVAIADGPVGDTWVLWRSIDGRFGASLHRNSFMVTSFQWVSSPGWTAADIAVGADGRPRLLRTKTDGTAEVSTVDAEGQLGAIQVHGSSGLTPRRISAGADGHTRLLFSAADGEGALFLLDVDNTLRSRHSIPALPGSIIE